MVKRFRKQRSSPSAALGGVPGPLLLLEAMNGIREEDLLLARDFLEAPAPAPAPRRRVAVRLARFALLAAVLIALLSATAYALGWFGIRERVFERGSSQPSPAAGTAEAEKEYWISQNGYEGSPEYRANEEWSRFYWDYVNNTDIDFDSGFLEGKSADYTETCHYYGCADQTMAEKLFEIAGRYGLKLHTQRLTPVCLEDFYRIAGTGAFLPEGGEGNGYIYEDGSFRLEGDIYDPLTGEFCFSFTFEKALAGTVMPYQDGAGGPEDYTEWEYTNIHGDRVLISYREFPPEEGGPGGSAKLFFDMDGVYLTVTAGAWYEPLPAGREAAQRVADAFLFHEALKSDVDLAYARHGPTVCSRPGAAATLADFLASPEGKAASEYASFALKQVGEAAYQMYDPWAGPQPALLEKMRRLSEAYGLTAPSRFGAPVLSQEERASAEWQGGGVTPEELADLGYSQALLEQLSPIDLVFDNGVLEGHLWQIIPKGALSVDLGPLPGEDAWESWFYRTEKGYVVFILANLAEPHGPDRGALILYEGENAWFLGRPAWYNTAYEIEATADGLDFSQYK